MPNVRSIIEAQQRLTHSKKVWQDVMPNSSRLGYALSSSASGFGINPYRRNCALSQNAFESGKILEPTPLGLGNASDPSTYESGKMPNLTFIELGYMPNPNTCGSNKMSHPTPLDLAMHQAQILIGLTRC
jgi:hypothetical protein